MNTETSELRKRSVNLIHHAANSGHTDPPGSLAALKKCLTASAAFVEIDIFPLADGSFALLHERDLSQQTDGAGDAVRATRQQVQQLHYQMNGLVSPEPVGFLEEAVALLQNHLQTRRLQLDLKPFTPLTPPILSRFLEILAPVQDRVQVTSVADWVLRALRQAAPGLALGFDPLLYLDLEEEGPRPEGIPPFRVGAYGLRDDHPLSAFQWGPLKDYFAARADALLRQAPAGCEWFIRAEVLHQAVASGFDWIGFLHQNGSTVDAWTIDPGNPAQVRLAQTLVEGRVDDLTADSPAQLAPLLPFESIH